MAFKLTRDQRHEFQAKAGIPVVVAVQAAATTLQAASFNGAALTVGVGGSVTFTPIVGTFFLTIAVAPPFPPESWNVVEVDGDATQTLEQESNEMQVANLIIVGN